MRLSVRLPRGTRVLDVADASRDALEDFLALDPNDRNALARWFIGPYRRAVAFAPKRVSLSTSRVVHQLSVAEVTASAQSLLEAAIAAASEPGAEGLLAIIPPIVDVVPIHDTLDAHGFAPMDCASERLSRRALSLLLADYLTRPDEFVARQGAEKARRPSVRIRALA